MANIYTVRKKHTTIQFRVKAVNEDHARKIAIDKFCEGKATDWLVYQF